MRRPHMRAWTGMLTLRRSRFFLSGTLMVFVIPDGIGNAHTDVPHLRFLWTSDPTGDRTPFLRVLDLRHIRFFAAQVQEKLEYSESCYS